MTGRSFSYARSVAPLLWAFVALAGTEMLVVHLLVALLVSPVLALVLTVASLATIAWLVLLIRSFRRLPVLVGDETLVMRTGFLLQIEVPRASVAGLRGAFTRAELKQAGVLNLALLAFPNVLVELGAPLPHGRRGKPVRAIAHRLDDPDGFRAALALPPA
jgi:hypothetical protein